MLMQFAFRLLGLRPIFLPDTQRLQKNGCAYQISLTAVRCSGKEFTDLP